MPVRENYRARAPRPVGGEDFEELAIHDDANGATARVSTPLARCPTCDAVVRRIRVVATAAHPQGGERLIDHVQTPVYVAIGEAGRERWFREMAAGADHAVTCRGRAGA